MRDIYVKFMTREEFVKMITEIHTFQIIDRDGNLITVDKRQNSNKPKYEYFNDIVICWRAPAFKLTAFDYDDVLKSGEGYVRYSTFRYGNKESCQGIILREKYGFQRED